MSMSEKAGLDQDWALQRARMRAVLFPWPDCHNVDLIHSCEGPVLLLAVNSLWAGQHDRDYEVIIFPSAPNCCLAALLALSILHTSDIYFKPSCCHYGIKVVSRHYHWELTQPCTITICQMCTCIFCAQARHVRLGSAWHCSDVRAL